MPRPSTSRPAAAGAARHREDVADGVVRGQVGRRAPPPVNTTCSATPCRSASRRSRVASRAAADDQQRGAVGTRATDRRQRPDQLVLALARHQPRHAQRHRARHRGRSASAARARAAGSGRNVSVSTPGGRCSSAASGPNAAANPARVYRLTKVTTSVSSPIRRSACRAPGSIDQPTSCPCVLATTRAMPAPAGAGRGQQRQRGRGAEPDGGGPVRPDQLGGPAGHAGTGQHQRARDAGAPRRAARRRTPRRPATRVRRRRARRRAAGRPGPAGRTGSPRPGAGSRWSPATCAPRRDATGPVVLTTVGDHRSGRCSGPGPGARCRAAAGTRPAAARPGSGRSCEGAATAGGRR